MPHSAWASDWAGRPTAPVDIGLRFVSDADIQLARGEAAKFAWAHHPIGEDIDNRVDCFNDALLRWIVARGTCKPHDSTIPWFLQDVDDATTHLSVGGARFIFDAIEMLRLEMSPLSREATNDELERMPTLLLALAAGPPLGAAPMSRARQARRLLARAIELMSIE